MTTPGPDKIVSASDVEKYCYCPLSWWLSEKNVGENKEELRKGSENHAIIGKDVKKIKVKEKESWESERYIFWFSLIAIIMGINGVAIIYSIYAPSPQGQAIMILLSIIAVLWVIVAAIFFYIGIMMEMRMKRLRKSPSVDSAPSEGKALGTSKADLDWKRRFLEAKWNTLLFFVVSGIMGIHGFIILFSLGEMNSQILSMIFLILALIWLIGSSFFYYISSKKEEKSKETKQTSRGGEGIRSFTDSEMSVILFAVVATVLASNSFTIFRNPHTDIGRILLIGAVLWLYGGFIFLYRAMRANLRLKLLINEQLRLVEGIDGKLVTKAATPHEIEEVAIDYERKVIWFAIIAMILALNAIIMNFSKGLEELYGALIAHIFEVVALLWLIGASFFLYMVLRYSRTTRRLREKHGIDRGTIEYVDALDEASEMLVSEKYGLRGRPDYIIKRDGKLVPVEVKTGRVPRGPLFSHIVQLAAYCLLIEDKYNQPPPYGIIRYTEVQHEIDYTNDLKNILISKINAMKKILDGGESHRSHKRPNKCKGCSRREMCPESLV
ncbi:MAG: CRISPR-associated protein Cas4 [Thermoplasmata archaeon]